jgi:hypothetical protein
MMSRTPILFSRALTAAFLAKSLVGSAAFSPVSRPKHGVASYSSSSVRLQMVSMKEAAEQVLSNPKWPPEWPYTDADFTRQDETDDGYFYQSPRLWVCRLYPLVIVHAAQVNIISGLVITCPCDSRSEKDRFAINFDRWLCVGLWHDIFISSGESRPREIVNLRKYVSYVDSQNFSTLTCFFNSSYI